MHTIHVATFNTYTNEQLTAAVRKAFPSVRAFTCVLHLLFQQLCKLHVVFVGSPLPTDIQAPDKLPQSVIALLADELEHLCQPLLLGYVVLPQSVLLISREHALLAHVLRYELEVDLLPYEMSVGDNGAPGVGATSPGEVAGRRNVLSRTHGSMEGS